VSVASVGYGGRASHAAACAEGVDDRARRAVAHEHDAPRGEHVRGQRARVPELVAEVGGDRPRRVHEDLHGHPVEPLLHPLTERRAVDDVQVQVTRRVRRAADDRAGGHDAVHGALAVEALEDERDRVLEGGGVRRRQRRPVPPRECCVHRRGSPG
jgi:hypothetical protein